MEFVTVTCHDLTSHETAILVKRLISLSNDELVLLIGCHVNNLVENLAVNNTSVGSLDKAVFVYLCKGCKIGDKSDVGTFGSLDGTHTAVMAVVNISNLESCTVTGQTTRSKCGQTSLMSQLTQRVVLVHELGQR